MPSCHHSIADCSGCCSHQDAMAFYRHEKSLAVGLQIHAVATLPFQKNL